MIRIRLLFSFTIQKCLLFLPRPQEIDEAARRRFVKRLYIPLPEMPARQQIIVNLMKTQVNTVSEKEIDQICNQTAGRNDCDIRSVDQKIIIILCVLYTVNVDSFACIHFRRFMKIDNFAWIKIISIIVDSLCYHKSDFHGVNYYFHGYFKNTN